MFCSIGRKPVLVLGIMSMLIAVVTRPFVPSLEMVTFLEFINGFGSMVSYLVPFVLRKSNTYMKKKKKKNPTIACVLFILREFVALRNSFLYISDQKNVLKTVILV